MGWWWEGVAKGWARAWVRGRLAGWTACWPAVAPGRARLPRPPSPQPPAPFSIQALLSAPNPDDPLDEGVARHWREDESGALGTAREWTALYAGG